MTDIRAARPAWVDLSTEQTQERATLWEGPIVQEATLQVGGFLGIGAHLVAVPYESLIIDDEGSKIQLPGASKDELRKLPESPCSVVRPEP